MLPRIQFFYILKNVCEGKTRLRQKGYFILQKPKSKKIFDVLTSDIIGKEVFNSYK